MFAPWDSLRLVTVGAEKSDAMARSPSVIIALVDHHPPPKEFCQTAITMRHLSVEGLTKSQGLAKDRHRQRSQKVGRSVGDVDDQKLRPNPKPTLMYTLKVMLSVLIGPIRGRCEWRYTLGTQLLRSPMLLKDRKAS